MKKFLEDLPVRVWDKIKTFHEKLEKKRKWNQIYSLLGIKKPLEIGDWAVEVDFARELVAQILKRKPEYILETGSGVSTVLSAYALKKNGGGRIVSLEHLEEYAAGTRSQIAVHGLARIASVVTAPLISYSLKKGNWQWYSLGSIESRKIDMMIVDGPPGELQKMSRYPALPLCHEHLHKNAIILLDDANRPDEQEIIKSWEEEFGLQTQRVPTKKGMAVLKARNPL